MRLLDQIIERLDCSSLMRAYKRTDDHARPPKTMLKIMIYAAMEEDITQPEKSAINVSGISTTSGYSMGAKPPAPVMLIGSVVYDYRNAEKPSSNEIVMKKLKSLEDQVEHLFVN